MRAGIQRALAVAALTVLPASAHACAACAAAADRNRSIFLFTTILLSLLPLAMVGAGLLWIARRARLAGELDQREEPLGTPPAAPRKA